MYLCVCVCVCVSVCVCTACVAKLLEDRRGETAKEQNTKELDRQKGRPTVRDTASLKGTAVKDSALLKTWQRATVAVKTE